MKYSFLFLLLFVNGLFYGQTENRIRTIQNNLEVLQVDNKGLSEKLKLDINVSSVSLSNFLLAISEVHQININVDPSLQGINVVNNFSDVTVADLIVFLCKEFDLAIDFTGNILSIRKYVPKPITPPEKEILVSFDPINNLVSLDLRNDPLEKVFRKIIDVTGQNLLYNSGMENIPITLYVKDVPLALCIQKLAETNGLTFSTSRDGFYLFDRRGGQGNDGERPGQQNRGRFPQGNSNFNYQVIDTLKRLVTVDLDNVPISNIVQALAYDLDLDYYMATPLAHAGNVSLKAKQIYLDELLTKIFESKVMTQAPQSRTNDNTQGRPSNSRGGGGANVPEPPPNMAFTFKKEGDIYFFGTVDQLSVRRLEVVQMMHRSVELLGDPMQSAGGTRSAGRTVGGNVNYYGGQNGIQNTNAGFNNQNTFGGNGNRGQQGGAQSNQFGNFSSNAEAIINILPDEILANLDIKIDFELNSFLVSGPAASINRFRKFINEIDKPVPVILIEVMIIEVRKTATVETGISWGIGEEPTTTQGTIFPETDLTLGAETVNNIIGGFDGFGSFNIGQVIPEFYANIKAMEQNGNIKIRSTPKLSTLNGHRANLSIGETTYYVVTNQSFIGTQNPTTTEIRNYQPIDAELAISIKPLVSGDGQITLDINVIQSDFSGERIEEDAPPGLTSREFSSIIRMKNQDVAILGGLEEKVKNDSGSGVPFLSRIPIIKWFFSQRVREDSKQKLTILIKPTIIY